MSRGCYEVADAKMQSLRPQVVSSQPEGAWTVPCVQQPLLEQAEGQEAKEGLKVSLLIYGV